MNIFITGSPKPQGRPRAFKRGKFTAVTSPVTQWRNDCKQRFIDEKNAGEYFEEAICVHLYFSFHRPNSHYGTGRNADKLKDSAPKYPTSTRSDLDNLAKAVMDAMNDSNIIKDDALIVQLVCCKNYLDDRSEAEGCLVSITTMEELWGA